MDERIIESFAGKYGVSKNSVFFSIFLKKEEDFNHLARLISHTNASYRRK